MRGKFITHYPLLCCALVLAVAVAAHVGARAQEEEKNFSGEGVVIAYQKNLRCSGCEATGQFVTGVEYWVVRVDKWLDDTSRNEKFILLKFHIYDRSPTAVEINSKKLRFTIRERREKEKKNEDCIGWVLTRWGPRETRPAEISDYELTKLGEEEVRPWLSLPPLRSLPCFITYHPPTVVEQ